MRLLPRDEKFFDLFAELARCLTRSAELLNRMFDEPERLGVHVSAIKDVEHEADELTRWVIERIDKSFVTPIDREDIHLLVSHLDGVIDLVDGTARRALMFHIHETKEPARALARVVSRAAGALEAAISEMKRPKVVAERTKEVKRLEEEGDAIYHEAIGQLFLGAPDPLEVIKWKDMYDMLEDTLDQCEDVANVLESISIKNS